jgi:hypothetical protein
MISPGRRPTIGRKGDWMSEKPLWALPGYNERQATHFRELASMATTIRLKARLLREAEEHEQLARGEPILVAAAE